MAFEKQVFISYAHIDNEPLTPNQQGWISRFHTSLSAMLSMRLGRKAEIWRDIKLSGNDIFADEIIQQFPKTALLISVLTPRYVESEWCTREAREFVKTAETTGGVLVDNKSRVLKVIKIPVDNEGSLPDVMKLSLGYPFYIVDEQQTPLELDPAYGEDFTQKFNLKLAKLAFDIAELIKRLDTAAAASTVSAAGVAVEKPAVFIADSSIDRRDDREAVIADLRLHGYPTLAEVQLPTDEASFLGELAAVLARCKLSVHTIGSLYGVVPDGPSEKSITVLENELAIEYSKLFGMKRIIWIPAGTKASSQRQQEFIDLLLSDPKAQLGADLITGDIEELKAAIHAALKKLEAPPPPPATAPAEPTEVGRKLVYIICDERDRKATIPLRKLLKAQGLESSIPAFEGDAATVRQSSQDLLASCDAVIVFYGNGDEAWKRSVDAEVRKSAGYRQGKGSLAPFTYLAEPPTADKSDLVDLEEPRLINCLTGFADAAMAEFVCTVAGKAKP
ncbi:MAG TPA: hypothetical protein VMT56_00600 [Candidatus Bathyarchaeia archaeon]|nr:hypothetical protein [Candidatus Bathyarchaeia archaeon]